MPLTNTGSPVLSCDALGGIIPDFRIDDLDLARLMATAYSASAFAALLTRVAVRTAVFLFSIRFRIRYVEFTFYAGYGFKRHGSFLPV